MNILIKGMERPKNCDECWALDDNGDYPMCLITQEQRGYDFNTRAKVMDRCPLIEIVTCRECIHRVEDSDFQRGHSCLKRRSNGGLYCEDNDFCSYGERANATQHTQCVECVEEEWIDWREEQEYEDRWNTMERNE